MKEELGVKLIRACFSQPPPPHSRTTWEYLSNAAVKFTCCGNSSFSEPSETMYPILGVGELVVQVQKKELELELEYF